MPVTKKSAKKPDETRKFPKGKIDVLKVGEHTVGRGTYQPGWKWSTHVKPIAKTDSCQIHHVIYVVSGTMAGVLDDGTKWKISPGELVDLPPGHNAWVVGAKPVITLDYTGSANKP